MEKLLTKEELESYLYKIRNTLCGYNYERLSNVIFFSNEVVYEYLCEIPLLGGDETVGDALNAVGAFIPVNLGDSSLKFLMSVNTPEQLKTLEAELVNRNRMEFLQLLTQISNKTEWFCLINLCETIRLFREKDYAAVLT